MATRFQGIRVSPSAAERIHACGDSGRDGKRAVTVTARPGRVKNKIPGEQQADDRSESWPLVRLESTSLNELVVRAPPGGHRRRMADGHATDCNARLGGRSAVSQVFSQVVGCASGWPMSVSATSAATLWRCWQGIPAGCAPPATS
jgi:hypothetical protein